MLGLPVGMLRAAQPFPFSLLFPEHLVEPVCTLRQKLVAMMSFKLVICGIPALPAVQLAPFSAFVEGPGRHAASHHDVCRLSEHPRVSCCH